MGADGKREVKDLERRLNRAGFQFVRQHRHRIWRTPDGRHTFALPATPSDWRSVRNTLTDLKRRGIVIPPE